MSAGGIPKMISTSIPARQPIRQPWSHERLVRERALVLGFAIDSSTRKSYESACNSYLAFVRLHDLPVDPTPETLSFYIVFMSHHISPRSVASYLSGITHQLEPFFPDVRSARSSKLVQQTLKGCHKLYAGPISRKRALTQTDLLVPITRYEHSSNHDDLLFLTLFLTGFFGLMRLGELVFPDDVSLQDWRKVTRRSSVHVTAQHYEFTLPAHKADILFEGSRVLVWGERFGFETHRFFLLYLESRDRLFSLASPLWLTASGAVPTRAFFMRRLRDLLPGVSVGGHSLRAGGATLLADFGIPPHVIQAAGRWASNTFQVYIRKHPLLLHSLLFSPR